MIKPSFIIELLEGEDTILSFKTPSGLAIWPIVRHDVITSIFFQNNDLDSAYTKRKVEFSTIFKTLFHSLIKMPFFIKRGKIIFFNSGITNVKRESDGLFYNRVTDPFYLKISKAAVLIEDTAMGTLRFPRIHQNVYPHLGLSCSAHLLGVLSNVSKKEKLIIEELTRWVTSKMMASNIEVDQTRIGDIIAVNFKQFKKKKLTYKWFLRIKKPKVLFIEDASYGNRSFLVLSAKELSIPVVELQHGFVNEDHIAYNVGNGLLKSEVIKKYYPDVYFSYGEFWKRSINFPNEIVRIGNPYLVQQIEEIKSMRRSNGGRPVVLFLSSAVSVGETIDFVQELKRVADDFGYNVMMRGHPLEKNEMNTRYRELIDIGVGISNEGSLYYDLFKSDIIVGEISTALFESLAIPEKKQFLFMSSYTNSYFSENVKIPKVYKETIREIFTNDKSSTSDSNYFWEENWEANFWGALNKIKS